MSHGEPKTHQDLPLQEASEVSYAKPRYAPAPSVQWTTIIIVILTWLMSAVLTYGILSTKVSFLEERVKTIENDERHIFDTYLTREEYQRFHTMLEEKMERNDRVIQEKLDRLIEAHPINRSK